MKKIDKNDVMSALINNKVFCDTDIGKVIKNCEQIQKSLKESLNEGGQGCSKCKRNSIIKKYLSKIMPSIEEYNKKIDISNKTDSGFEIKI